jgi:hypothetical protein
MDAFWRFAVQSSLSYQEVLYMHKLARVLAGSAILAIVALWAPASALAAGGGNSIAPAPAKSNKIEGTVRSDGKYTGEKTKTDGRHKTDTVNDAVELDLQKNVDGGLCARVVKFGGAAFDEKCWNAGERGQKILANGVTSGTVFFVEAKKRGTGSNNDWSGTLIY